jgi:hypothetical protein
MAPVTILVEVVGTPSVTPGIIVLDTIVVAIRPPSARITPGIVRNIAAGIRQIHWIVEAVGIAVGSRDPHVPPIGLDEAAEFGVHVAGVEVDEPRPRIMALAGKALILGRRGRAGDPLRHLAIGPVMLVDRPRAFGVQHGDHAAQLVMDQDAGRAIDPPRPPAAPRWPGAWCCRPRTPPRPRAR